ncbi:MAG: hypothetical protein KTR29_09635 [Rhodothermaceae bacterium]|nr:hypothetical protein [Rhodothermaceae bacterium]
MNRSSSIGFLLIIVCLQACSVFQDGGSDSTVDLGEEFQLRVGETAVFIQVNHLLEEETRITFQELEEDSRCPIGVNCIWEGQVVLAFDALTDGDTEHLDYQGFVSPEGDAYLNQSFGDIYELQLLRVDPYPVAATNGESAEGEDDKVATLKIAQVGIVD